MSKVDWWVENQKQALNHFKPTTHP